MTIENTLKHIQESLTPHTGSFAIPQSEEILCHLTGYTRSQLYISNKLELSQELLSNVESIISRRIKGEPLQYILQTAYFYNREFFVTPSVLIPRPDTETLVDFILRTETPTPQKFLDIGTGSGIIVSILTEQRPWKGIGVDICYDALRIARKNNKSGYSLLCSNKLNAIKRHVQFDFIVSNPPYISRQEIFELDPEVRDMEPHCALYGGHDGLDFYRDFAANAYSFLKTGGNIYCEIGYNQADLCKIIFEKHGWTGIKIMKDLGNNPRVISAQAPENT